MFIFELEMKVVVDVFEFNSYIYNLYYKGFMCCGESVFVGFDISLLNDDIRMMKEKGIDIFYLVYFFGYISI